MILTGCPFSGIKGVNDAIEKSKSNILLHVSDIEYCSLNELIVNGSSYLHSEIKSSYIRYPYDLIPPFTSDYSKREAIEYHKSVALLFDNCAINKLASTWQLRNRQFSLLQYKKHGGDIVETYLLNDHKYLNSKKKYIVKSIGNCYVSEELTDVNNDIFSVERDGEDIATIFPAQQFDLDNAGKYFNLVDHVLIQERIEGKELRVHVIGKDVFLLERQKVAGVDQSTGDFLFYKAEFNLDKIYHPIRSMMSEFNLDYLCFDLIMQEGSDRPFVIDINPYGSLPPTSEFPEHTNALAQLLISRHDNL